MKKHPIILNDSPAFISNRIMSQYLITGVLAFNDGVATKEDVDTTMK